MSRFALLAALPFAVLVLTLSAPRGHAQSFYNASSSTEMLHAVLDPAVIAVPAAPAAFSASAAPAVRPARKPDIDAFSRLAVGADISPLGPGAEVAVNLNEHLDLRAEGNLFSYSTSFNTNGFDVDAKLHLASAGVSLDYYPFHKGFRLSPGVMFYNQNRFNALAPVAAGTSFTLNDQSFYAATPNAAKGITQLTGAGSLGLHSTRPAFTATTGWGSLIPRSGRHWAIPFEIGAAFTGVPAVNMTLTGWGCEDAAQTTCTDVTSTTNPLAIQIQSSLQAQLVKWRKDLDPLKVYPIISTGIVFNFNIR